MTAAMTSAPFGGEAGGEASGGGGEPELVLTAADLHRSFGATPALAGASLRVAAGEIVAIMGPSGSGKSTLLHCLAGILVPDAGTVRYRGQGLGALSDRGRSELRRSEFGFVFQFGQLVPELSCLQNVALPMRLARVGRGAAERAAREWLDRLDVGHVADKRPGETSGGEGQRVAIARALVGRPSVVFADEPTGALDSLNGERVMGLLADSARQTGAAVVLVTHEPRVAAYADREVVVRDGRTRDLEPAR
jgi:putative ABC transport system ATP-binding protein